MLCIFLDDFCSVLLDHMMIDADIETFLTLYITPVCIVDLIPYVLMSVSLKRTGL